MYCVYELCEILYVRYTTNARINRTMPYTAPLCVIAPNMTHSTIQPLYDLGCVAAHPKKNRIHHISHKIPWKSHIDSNIIMVEGVFIALWRWCRLRGKWGKHLDFCEIIYPHKWIVIFFSSLVFVESKSAFVWKHTGAKCNQILLYFRLVFALNNTYCPECSLWPELDLPFFACYFWNEVKMESQTN